MEKLVLRFKALSDETRFKLFLLLAEKTIMCWWISKGIRYIRISSITAFKDT